jgi:hypothetical protein
MIEKKQQRDVQPPRMAVHTPLTAVLQVDS